MGSHETIHPVRPQKKGHRGLCVTFGLLTLFSPFLVPPAMWHFAPVSLEKLYVRYTGWDKPYFQQSIRLERPLSPAKRRFARNVYLERSAIETIVRVYNVLPSGLALAALASLLALIIHVVSLKFLQPSLASSIGETVVFSSCLAFSSILWRPPISYALVAVASSVFVMNFPLASLFKASGRSGLLRFLACFFFLMTPYVSHILTPVALCVFVTWCVWPNSSTCLCVAVKAGRVVVCLISFPLLILFFFSRHPIQAPPEVNHILAARNLYDVEIDYPGNQVLVTTKDRGTGFAISLDLERPPKEFRVPTGELEDIALDHDRREIYHVDRDTGNILVIDADTFELQRTGRIPIPADSGTTKLALVESADRIFVSFENNYLAVVDRDSLETETATNAGNVNLLADETRNVLYLNYGKTPVIEAIDARTLETIYRAHAPMWGERIVRSEKRQELYVPDAIKSQVWVYSTPDLDILRRIPTQFGVRALAVDDEHGLLLAASVVTGYVDVIDLATSKTVQHHYVGKYGRIIAAEPLRQRAFITITREGLYSLRYGAKGGSGGSGIKVEEPLADK